MLVLSRLDLYNTGRRFVLSRAKRIDPGVIDTEGSDANLFVGSTSFMAHAVSRQVVDRTLALTLDGAEGEDLDRFVLDRYQVPRKGAAPALGTVQLTRSSVAAGAGTVAAGTKLITLAGIEYITTTPASFGVSDVSSTADVRSVQAGFAFQVGANQIRRFDNASLLFDPSLEVNNAEASSGGADVEKDDQYRERARGFWITARRGTLGAIEFGATTVAGIESAQAVEALTTGAQPARVVTLYIADSTGVASKALAFTVRVALNEYRAAGIAVVVSTSVPQIVDVQLLLTFQAGVDTVQLAASIRAAVLEFVNSLAVNQPLLVGELQAVLVRFKQLGLIVTEDSIVAPVGDLYPTPGRTLRARLENITVL